MVSSRTDDETRFPIYSAIEKRFKNTELPAICYPVGISAYFADQMLTFGVDAPVIIEELQQSMVRRGRNQEPVRIDAPMDVAIDAFITNKFWMVLSREIQDAHIYDSETFLIYMATYSPYAIWIGLGDPPKEGLCHPPKDDKVRIVEI